MNVFLSPRSLLCTRKLLLLFVTGAPGIQRLAFILALSYLFTTADVGIAAADLGVASFLALFAGGAVSGQIMALWGRYPDSASRDTLKRQGLYWQLGALPIASGMAWGLHQSNLIDSPWSVLLFFAGFSVWQVERTKLLSDRKLKLLSFIETALVALVVLGSTWAGSASTALGLYGLVLLVTGMAITPIASRGSNSSGDDSLAHWNGLGYKGTGALAINGVVGSGREHLTIPVIRLIADNGIAGVVAQVSSVVAVLLLAPRALANNYVPDLSRHAGYGVEAARVLRRYRRAMRRTLVTIAVVLVVAVALGWFVGMASSYLFIALLAGLVLIAGQLSLLPSTVLMVRQTVAPILKSAFLVTTVWAAVVLILSLVDMKVRLAVASLLGLSIVAAVLRAIYLQSIVDGSTNEKSSEQPVVELS